MIDIDDFRLKFPAFANPMLYPTDSILLMAEMVDCYIDVGNRWFRCVKCQELMTELLTAHLLIINGTPTAPASGATGIISNARLAQSVLGSLMQRQAKARSWPGSARRLTVNSLLRYWRDCLSGLVMLAVFLSAAHSVRLAGGSDGLGGFGKAG